MLDEKNREKKKNRNGKSQKNPGEENFSHYLSIILNI